MVKPFTVSISVTPVRGVMVEGVSAKVVAQQFVNVQCVIHARRVIGNSINDFPFLNYPGVNHGRLHLPCTFRVVFPRLFPAAAILGMAKYVGTICSILVPEFRNAPPIQMTIHPARFEFVARLSFLNSHFRKLLTMSNVSAIPSQIL